MLNNEKLKEMSNKIREIVKDSPLPDLEKNIDALLKGMLKKWSLSPEKNLMFKQKC
jgi:hypothetical protein